MERDPIRWKDDPELDASLREDLARVAELDPPALDVSAGLERLEHAIRTTGGGSGGGGAAPWIIGGLVVAALGAPGIWALGAHHERSTHEEDAATPSLQEDSAPERGDEAAHEPSAELDRGLEPSTNLEESGAASAIEPTPGTPARPPRGARRARHAPPAPSGSEPRTSGASEAMAPSAPNDLREEMELLARARNALRSEPARALALADEGQRRFPPPRGVYGEEREAISVLALSVLGRAADAQRRGAAFLRMHPSGPWSERVRRALAP